MLELDDIWKSYRGIPAVRALSLRAKPGDVVGLLGRNGSGKSTTVRMIVGLLRPSRGVVRWQGADIQQQLLNYQSIVGYVPEEPRLSPQAARKQASREAKLAEIAEQVDNGELVIRQMTPAEKKKAAASKKKRDAERAKRPAKRGR